MTEYVKAWQCIGCGRIESQETCLGICQDKPQTFVYASDYEVLLTLVRQLALASPRDGEWERSYRSLQAQARKALGMAPAAAPAKVTQPGFPVRALRSS